MLLDRLVKTEKEFKKLKKQEIQNKFIKTNYIKLVFNLIWFVVTLKIYLQAVDKVLRDEAFNIAKNSRYDGY